MDVPERDLDRGKRTTQCFRYSAPLDNYQNLAIRQNGAVLCTSISASSIFQVDPFAHTETTVHQFAPTDNILGITEVYDDVFVVVSANISTATSTAWPGSAKMWKVDMGAWELVRSFLILLSHRCEEWERS